MPAKCQVGQLLAQRYQADLEEMFAMFSEEVETTNVLAGNLECEVDWEIEDFTGGPYLSNLASIRLEFSSLWKA